MSRNISTSLAAHFASEVATLAMLWAITRVDGTEYFFTDHDIDITYGGDTYEADTGLVPTLLDTKEGLSTDNMETMAFLDPNKIIRADIDAGLFDHATVDCKIVNFEDLTQGHLTFFDGWTLGQMELHDEVFQAEMRGKAARLQQTIGERYSHSCRAEWGDARCGIDLEDTAETYREDGTVTSVTDGKRVFIDTSITDTGGDDVYRYGKIVWASGAANDGYEMEIKKWDPDTGEFTLFLDMPHTILAGDAFTAYWGCDKKRETCVARGNIKNMRAEPFIPGPDKLVAEIRRGA